MDVISTKLSDARDLQELRSPVPRAKKTWFRSACPGPYYLLVLPGYVSVVSSRDVGCSFSLFRLLRGSFIRLRVES